MDDELNLDPFTVLPIVAILLVLAWLRLRKKKPKPADDPDLDALTLDQLKRAGSDLDKPHPMEFFLYFPTEESARQASVTLEVQGFDVAVDRSAEEVGRLCTAMPTCRVRCRSRRQLSWSRDRVSTPPGGCILHIKSRVFTSSGVHRRLWPLYR